MSSLRKTVLAKGSKRLIMAATIDFKPEPWTKYYQNEYLLETEAGVFHIFSKGASGPILLCLHGGGYSALTWSLFAKEIVERIDCQVVALDLRGHGSTRCEDEYELSLNTLATDVERAMRGMFRSSTPPIVLIGHSMGGAVAVEAARRLPKAAALCVIDVVEGSALESLASMQHVLRNRPPCFDTIEDAVKWSCRVQTRNWRAAKVSMPGQIKNIRTGELAAEEILRPPTSNIIPDEEVIRRAPHLPDAIPEEEPDDNEMPGPAAAPTGGPNYSWRIDLSRTERHWNGWFQGLSKKFLDLPIPKVLMLANVHALDTALTVGQMQGKFQFQILQRSGHAIHEDQPEKVADIIANFLIKQRLAVAKGSITPVMPAC